MCFKLLHQTISSLIYHIILYAYACYGALSVTTELEKRTKISDVADCLELLRYTIVRSLLRKYKMLASRNNLLSFIFTAEYGCCHQLLLVLTFRLDTQENLDSVEILSCALD